MLTQGTTTNFVKHNYTDMSAALIVVATVFILLLITKIGTEKFNNNTAGVGSVQYFYNKQQECPYQIGAVHIPQYNYPEYIGKYPYYKYYFSPFNSAVY